METRTLTDTGLQFKFLVPSSVVGAVLGRGGATVAAIKRTTGAYVQFTRPGTATNSGKDRMMIVACENQGQLGKAIEMVLEVGACAGWPRLGASLWVGAPACRGVATRSARLLRRSAVQRAPKQPDTLPLSGAAAVQGRAPS